MFTFARSYILPVCKELYSAGNSGDHIQNCGEINRIAIRRVISSSAACRRQKACGGRIVELGPRIDAHAARNRRGFRRGGAERLVKDDDAKRRRQQDEGFLRRRCFLPRPEAMPIKGKIVFGAANGHQGVRDWIGALDAATSRDEKPGRTAVRVASWL